MAVSSKNISVKPFLQPPRVTTADGVCFGEVVYNPGGICGPRRQQNWQLVAVISGDVEVEIDEVKHPIPSGQVRLMVPGKWEFFHFSRELPTHHLWVDFAPDKLPLRNRLEHASAFLPLSGALESLIRIGLGVSSTEESGKEAIQSLGQAVLALYCSGSSAGAPPMHPAVLKACKIMEEELDQPMSLAALARRSGISSNHLVLLFKRHLSSTPIEHLWKLRTQRAALLLTSSGLSVGEIAFQTGFQTSFHLSRRFQNGYGLSPRAYRLRAWGREQKI
jgi:AraC family transcriptional regulator of arabinose operon